MKKLKEVLFNIIGWGVLLLIPSLFVGTIYWLSWGRIIFIDAKGERIERFVDVSFFYPLKPDMSRRQIDSLVGQPLEMKAYCSCYDGSVDESGITWIYKEEEGMIHYYVSELINEKSGTVKFYPENMLLKDFLKKDYFLLGKRFVEVDNEDKSLIYAKIKKGKIEYVTWYNE